MALSPLPPQALSWYAVGMYYHCVRQYEQARRYFCRATTMDSGLAAAWIAYGHSFAAMDERDQVGRCGSRPVSTLLYSTAESINSRHCSNLARISHGSVNLDRPLNPQAMAAYRAAARLFPGLHLPILAMGMEYSSMSNLVVSTGGLHEPSSPSGPSVGNFQERDKLTCRIPPRSSACREDASDCPSALSLGSLHCP